MIPFLISSVVVGIPYALLEVTLGQWMKEGGIGAWNLTPLFKGSNFFAIVASDKKFSILNLLILFFKELVLLI